MTYSESARGVMISFHRVRQEIRAHGGNYDTCQEFLAEYGVQEEYDAGDVMDFLGY